MNWDEIQRMMRDTEDARRALQNSSYAREAFDPLDSNALRTFQERQSYGVTSMVEEIVKRQIIRNHDQDHAIAEYFKNRSLFGDMSTNQSRLLENQFRINDAINSATSGISARDVLQNISGPRLSVETALRAHQDLRESYVSSIQRWENLSELIKRPGVSDLVAQHAAFSAATWSTSVNEVIEQVGALKGLTGSRSSVELMLEPAFSYGRFASGTLELLQQARTEDTNALSGSLVLADAQIVKITAVQETFIEKVDEDKPASSVFSNFFDRQQRELLHRRNAVPPYAGYPVLVALSPTAKLFEQCDQCFVLIEYCNGASRERKGSDIFNPSTSWLTITSGLLSNIARDRQTFKEFALNLYNLLYESVSPRKRLLNDGLVTEAENRVIEVLKNFRNKWLIHDATQGSDAAVEEDRKIVAADLAWLGVRRFPVTAKEYARLQSRLLEEVEVFLALIVHRLSPPAGNDED